MRNRRSVEIVTDAPVTFDMGDRGPKEPCAPSSFFRSQSSPNIDWPDLVPYNPDNSKYVAQIPTGTLHDGGDNGSNQPQYEWNRNANGRRWSPPVDWKRNGGNRSGE